MNLNTIHCGDAVEYLRTLPDGCVNCVVTSPPYYGLRDYGVEGQIGLEETLPEYLSKLRILFAEVRRVLRDDGVMWVNMGDSYTNGSKWGGATSGKQAYAAAAINKTRERRSNDLPPKNLLGVPWRLAFALQDDGWILRSDCIWHKPSVMPESVTDRPTKSHEYVFLLAKSDRYWYDADAVREPSDYGGKIVRLGEKSFGKRQATGMGVAPHGSSAHDTYTVPLSRNMRTVWTLSTEPNAYAHFAAFPQKLVRRCILAGCPREVCAKCGAPYVRETKVSHTLQNDVSAEKAFTRNKMADESHWQGYPRATKQVETLGFLPTCTCGAGTRPGVVLDPFMGSGTTALVARAEGRDFLGCDLNPEYVAMAEQRLAVPYTPRLFFDDEFVESEG